MNSTTISKRSTGVQPLTILRCMVGFFYLPHVLSKITGFAGTVTFFEKAGFHPAPVFVVFSGAMELAVGLALLFGVLTKYASLMSAGLMLVAAYAIFVVKGTNWLWNVGGIEYLIFWGMASLIVFWGEWLKEPGLLEFLK